MNSDDVDEVMYLFAQNTLKSHDIIDITDRVGSFWHFKNLKQEVVHFKHPKYESLGNNNILTKGKDFQVFRACFTFDGQTLSKDFCRRQDWMKVYREFVSRRKSIKTKVYFNDSIKKKIDDFVKSYKAVKRMGINLDMNRGILLSGKPGNGKTYVAKYIFESLGIQFDQCDEKSVLRRSVIMNCLIDDISSETLRRQSSTASVLLSNLDNNKCKGNFVRVFTTNENIAEIDSAFKRPGRIDTIIAVEEPNDKTRTNIFKDFCKEIDVDVDIVELVALTDGCSYAKINLYKTYLIDAKINASNIDLKLIHKKINDSYLVEQSLVKQSPDDTGDDFE